MTASVFFVGSLVLLSAGIVGEYIGRVYDEVRHRPLSIIAQVYAAEKAAYRPQPARPVAVKANGQNSDLEKEYRPQSEGIDAAKMSHYQGTKHHEVLISRASSVCASRPWWLDQRFRRLTNMRQILAAVTVLV